MNRSVVQPLLVAWVKSLTGLDVAQFENEPRVRYNTGIALLSWVSNASVGIEDTRWEFDDTPIPGNNATATVTGNRLVSLQVSIETLTQQPGGPNAVAFSDALRNRVRLPSSLSALEDMNLGLVGVQQFQNRDYKLDQRMVSRAIVEIRFNDTSFEADTAINTIETVEVTSTIKDVAGTLAPASIQLTGEVLP